MCGRYTFKNPAAIAAALERLGIKPRGKDRLPQRYNVAPSQTMPVVKSSGSWTVEPMRWGHTVQFGPAAKPQLLINARSETVAEKPTFRHGLQAHRCLVPADGFFEWLRLDGGKVKIPFHIRLQTGAPFWIAGLFWPEAGDQPERYIILTTAPNQLMADIHDRMPAIMDEAAAREWLTSGPITPARLPVLCASYRASLMTATRVSSFVNSAKHDSPECIVPAAADEGPAESPPPQAELF